MTWKEVYEKSNHSEYTNLIDIKQPAVLIGNYKKFFKSYKYVILFICILFLILLFLVFKTNVKAIFASIVIILFFISTFIYYNYLKISIKSDKMKINIELKKYEIDINNLITIFLTSKKNYMLLFFPINIYYINIIYKENNGMQIMTLPTIMLYKEDVYKFFKNFKFNNFEKEAKEIIRNKNK